MRTGLVYFASRLAGKLVDTGDEFVFTYEPDYILDGCPISVTLPLRSEPYRSQTMFPFFDGLIPEGWLLNVAIRNWKLDPNDRMGLLLSCCEDPIGAVSIKEGTL